MLRIPVENDKFFLFGKVVCSLLAGFSLFVVAHFMSKSFFLLLSVPAYNILNAAVLELIRLFSFIISINPWFSMCNYVFSFGTPLIELLTSSNSYYMIINNFSLARFIPFFMHFCCFFVMYPIIEVYKQKRKTALIFSAYLYSLLVNLLFFS